MKNYFLALLLLTFGFTSAQAAPTTKPKDLLESLLLKGLPIAASVEQMTDSDDKTIIIENRDSVKDMVIELAQKIGSIEDESDLTWSDATADGWEADSTVWAPGSFEDGLEYISSVDVDLETDGMDPDDAKAYKKKVTKTIENFMKLKTFDVEYAVGPVGANQCGVRLGGLIIFDKKTGKVYSIDMEASGPC